MKNNLISLEHFKIEKKIEQELARGRVPLYKTYTKTNFAKELSKTRSSTLPPQPQLQEDHGTRQTPR